jgi:tryptophan synthase alpha chain
LFVLARQRFAATERFPLAPRFAAFVFAFTMDRITAAFARAQAENRAAFVAYLCAGDPDFDTSLDACRALLQNGVDILELGVPFSDPLADGLTNQLAAQRALEGGMTMELVNTLVRSLRAEFPAVPLVFYTYYNLVFSNGTDSYVREAKAAGLDGLLVLDLPPEESGDVAEACAREGLKTVYIVAPTTPPERLPCIANAATGFIYYVSREGVTGVRDVVATGIPEAVAAIRCHTSLPVVVGFGIGKREHVAQVAQYADGVVVGSALVNVIRDHLTEPEKIAPAMGVRALDLTTGTRRA